MSEFISANNLDKIVGLLIIILLLVLLIRYKIIEYNKKRKQKKRFKRGAVLETKARRFLEKKGYKIVADQYTHYHSYLVDGKPEQSKLIVDYVVKKNGKLYLVEVKSGESAISIKNKNTRRQILEYDFVIENDGIFLLDMENERMSLIEFTPKSLTNYQNSVKFLILFAVIGTLLPYWAVKLPILLLMVVFWFFPNTIEYITVLGEKKNM